MIQGQIITTIFIHICGTFASALAMTIIQVVRFKYRTLRIRYNANTEQPQGGMALQRVEDGVGDHEMV